MYFICKDFEKSVLLNDSYLAILKSYVFKILANKVHDFEITVNRKIPKDKFFLFSNVLAMVHYKIF